MIRVLVGLRRRIYLDAVAAALANEPDLEIVATASSGSEVIQKTDQTQPDVAVVGWFLPTLNGLETTRKITTPSGPPAVVLLSDSPEDRSVVQALRAGASACLGSQSPFSALTEAIRHVANGGVFLSRDSDPFMAAAVKDGRATPRETLTARERQVLQLIAEGHSTKETASVLGISRKTADRHRAGLMEKLNIHNVASLTRYAVRQRLIEP